MEGVRGYEWNNGGTKWGMVGSSFRGEHRYSLDDKGRLVLPQTFRAALGSRVVVTRGLDECVAVYSPAEWARNEKKLRGLSVSRRDFVRFVLASAEDVALDRQGRMTIPSHLREYAKIERESVVVGVGSRRTRRPGGWSGSAGASRSCARASRHSKWCFSRWVSTGSTGCCSISVPR